MKKFIAIIATLFTILSVSAQAPEKMNYQAVARDLSGLPLVSTVVNLQFDILQGSATGTVAYSETQSKTTNQFGLFTAEIGAGTVVAGSFPGMAWGTSAYFLRITVNGDVMPATQLLSVPYALYAKTSGGAGAGLVAGPGIDITGGVITSTSDTSSTNEFQTLTTNATNDTVFLSNNGGFVYIPAIAGDDWGTDTVNTSGLNILGSGTVANPLIVVDNDTSLTNELQNLLWNSTDSNIINISNGTGIQLSSNTPSTNQVLTWNGANWIAQAAGGGWTQGVGNDIYNNTDSVGIGVIDPKALLHVSGGGFGKPIALFEQAGFLNAAININHTGSNTSGINFQNGGTTTSSIFSSTSNLMSLLSDNVVVGTGTATGKLQVNTLSSATNPTLQLHETSTGYSRIKHTNTVTGGKYWITEAGISATDALSGYSIGYENGGGTVLPFVVYGDSKVGINNLATPLASFHVMDNTANGGIVSEGFSQEGAMIIARNNFTFPNRGAVQNGDVLGVLSFSGYDGTTFGKGPQLKATATENFTTTSNGSELSFSTIVNGTNTDQDVLRLLNDGTVEVISNLRLLNGAGTAGEVLTSDAAGNATWQVPGGGGNDTSLIDSDGDTHINVESAPDQDVIHFNLGNSTGYAAAEYFTMVGPRLEAINNGGSVFIGEGAGANDDLTTNQNVFIGLQSGSLTTTGQRNVANGIYSLQNNTVGSFNTALGVFSMQNNIGGNFNTALGAYSLLNNTSGFSNVAIGRDALRNNSSASNNTAIGNESGDFITTGSDNTFLGSGADATVNNLTNATAIGANAIVTSDSTIQLGDNTNIEFDRALMPGGNAGTANQILQSNGPGNAPTWANAGADLDWTIGTGTIYNTLDNIGIGTTAPTYKLDVDPVSSFAGQIARIRNTNAASTNNVLQIENNGSGDGINIAQTGTSPGTKNGISSTTSGVGATNNFGGNFSVSGALSVNTALRGFATASGGAQATGIYATAGGTTSSNTYGVYGQNFSSTTAIAYAGYFQNLNNTGSGTYGVRSDVSSTNTNDQYGFYAGVNSASGGTKYGIYTSVTGGTTNWAAYFASGDVYVGNGLVIPTGASAGHVLTSDAAGNATWQTAGGADGNGIYSGSGTLSGGNTTVTMGTNNLAFVSTATAANSFSVDGSTFSVDALNNRIGFGTALPTAPVHVVNSTDLYSTIVDNSTVSASNTYLMFGTNSGTGTGSKYGFQIRANGTGGAQNYGAWFLAMNANSSNTGVNATATASGTSQATGIFASAGGNGTGVTQAVYAQNSSSSTGVAYAGRFRSLNNSSGLIYGVRSEVSSTTTGDQYAFRADVTGAASAGTRYGIYTYVSGGTTNWAAYFANGDVYVGDGLVIPTGAGANKVLTSDAAGNATWQDLPKSINFSANASTTSIPAGTTTALIFDNVEYDNGGNFNVATGAFTSSVTGVYHIDAVVTFDASTNHEIQLQILRNGGTHKIVTVYTDPANNYTTAHISADVYLPVLNNVSIGIYQNSGGNINPTGAGSGSRVYFTGHLVR